LPAWLANRRHPAVRIWSSGVPAWCRSRVPRERDGQASLSVCLRSPWRRSCSCWPRTTPRDVSDW